jgi:hypothetical protein
VIGEVGHAYLLPNFTFRILYHVQLRIVLRREQLELSLQIGNDAGVLQPTSMKTRACEVALQQRCFNVKARGVVLCRLERSISVVNTSHLQPRLEPSVLHGVFFGVDTNRCPSVTVIDSLRQGHSFEILV